MALGEFGSMSTITAASAGALERLDFDILSTVSYAPYRRLTRGL